MLDYLVLPHAIISILFSIWLYVIYLLLISQHLRYCNINLILIMEYDKMLCIKFYICSIGFEYVQGK